MHYFQIFRKFLQFLIVAAGLSVAGRDNAGAATLPAGFTETDVATVNNPVGMVFGKNAGGNKSRAYIWDRWGSVWIVEDGEKLQTPLLTINEEVADYGDYGLLGFALDPNFLQNGYVYCLYVVDRHHLLYYGTSQYNPNANIRSQATIGRVTRYTCVRSNDFRTVDPASRKVLLGETRQTGFPILHTSHGVGALVFGTDGTLLASCGDGASFAAMDAGGTNGGSFGPQALADGIITAAENIGAFRCQMLDSLNGKVVRIDPATGDGVPSNPYYQSGAPRSARSRLWSLGLRNPCRMTLKPGTGSHNPADGDPGVLYIGDVGWNLFEDMQVADGPGQNFGWPLYEGYYQNESYWPRRPSGMNAADHKLPAIDWHHGSQGARVMVDGKLYKVGASGSPVTGTSFLGNAACGSVWYTGTDFPAEWRNIYFQADAGSQWVRAFQMNDSNQVVNARPFASGERFVFLTTHPETGGIYYCAVQNGSSAGLVRRISYAPDGNRPPVAVASSDRQYGRGPLTVQFSSALSSDPEGRPMTYLWNFGDGTTSTDANPVKVFDTGINKKRYDVLLTVRDAGGATASSTVVVTMNNTPPQVNITSPQPGLRYPVDGGAVAYDLTADVSDGEDAISSLTHEWTVFLVHDNHEHVELSAAGRTATATFNPLGNDPAATYYYRIELKVTDPMGLSTTRAQLFLPDTGTSPIVINPDFFALTRGAGMMMNVLFNDHGAVTDADFTTLEIVTPPANGAALPDPVSGTVRYLHNGSATATDSFTYRVKTHAGVQSATGKVDISIGAPAANNAPVAMGDSVTIERGGNREIAVLGNDTDPGGAVVPGSLVILTQPLEGFVSINAAGGKIHYYHGNTPALQDSFTYSVADASGARPEPVKVQIFISTANGAPVVGNPGSQTSLPGDVVNLQIEGSDPNGTALTWTATGLPQGLVISGSGLISGTVAAGAESSTVTATASDGSLTGSATFAWTITTPPSGNGLLAEYFDGLTPGANPALLTRTDNTLNFDWTGSPGPGVPVDMFSVRWTGDIVPLYTETYHFGISADNGVRVWIDNVLVLDKWNPIGTGGSYDFTAQLTAGRRTPFKVEFYEQWGYAGILFHWFSARQGWEVVPSTAFVPAGGAVDSTPPSVSLAGPVGTVSVPFTLVATFSEPVHELTKEDFAVTNGAATALAASEGSYVLTVTPAAGGNVKVSLPAGKCFDGGGNGNLASNEFVVAFIPQADRPPVIGPPGNQASLQGSIVSLQIQGADPEGKSLTWSATGLPAGLSINTGTGLIAGTVSLSAARSYNVSVTLRDAGNLTDTETFIWTTAPPATAGIRGEYYNGASPGGAAPLMVRTDSSIDFDWGAGSPGGNVPADMFSVRWMADLVPPFTEEYTFTVAGDNGYRLWIDNTLLIDNWQNGGWRSAKINLTAGQAVPLRLEYYEEWGGAGISLYWESPRRRWEAISAANLIPPQGAPDSAGIILPSILRDYDISKDPSGGTVLTFTRPLTTANAATVVETSVDLMTWTIIDTPATVSRPPEGNEVIRIRVLEPVHRHEDGTQHVHEITDPERFYRVRLMDAPQ